MSIQITPVHFNPQVGHYIVVDAEMDNGLNVTCHVSLTCTDKVVAFTTGVTLTYFDDGGQQLGSSKGGQPFTLACGPAPLIGAAHTSGTFSDRAPANTARIMVTQAAANDWGPIIGTIVDIVQTVIKALGGGLPTDQPVPDGQVDDFPNPDPPDPGPDELRVQLTLSAKA